MPPLDYKQIINLHYGQFMSSREIALELHCSKSGVNLFLAKFEECDKIGFPLPKDITNYGIAAVVYSQEHTARSRDENYAMPDFAQAFAALNSKKNMTLRHLWDKYVKECEANGSKFYQYRQYCKMYNDWVEKNKDTLHFVAVAGQRMEVDFAGKVFYYVDLSTGEYVEIVVFVAVLPYSQAIYAEGMSSACEQQWIEVNNHALNFFGGVPAIVVCDNCKQAVIANKDWIAPELNKSYAEWAEHNNTVILPAKVRKPRYKASVENAVGILEKGIFHDLEGMVFHSLSEFNQNLWSLLEDVNSAPFQKKEHNRFYYLEEERLSLQALPAEPYEFMVQKIAKVAPDYHITFDNSHYSVDQMYLHQEVLVKASATKVKIFTKEGQFLCEHPRATRPNQWLTNPEHLPSYSCNLSSWNGPKFIREAYAIGPNTQAAIQTILNSRDLEVQSYRSCLGVLNLKKKYGPAALEETCRLALSAGKASYSYIKKRIIGVADEMAIEAQKQQSIDERNKGAYAMDTNKVDVNRLLSRSEKLVNGRKDGGV